MRFIQIMSEEIANLSAFSVFVPLSLARTLQKKKKIKNLHRV